MSFSVCDKLNASKVTAAQRSPVEDEVAVQTGRPGVITPGSPHIQGG